MNEKKYSNQAITEYLLGSLPEREAELFDELSIVDDEFAADLNCAENDLVDAYVRGELTGARLETFESRYLASAVRREKVNFAQALQGLAEKVAAQTNEENSAEKTVDLQTKPNQTRNGFFSARNIFALPPFPIAQWAFAAAAIALIIVGGWLWVENARLNRQANDIQAKRDELLQREQDLQNQLQTERSANSAAQAELAQTSEERARLEQELERAQTLAQQRAIEQARAPKPTPAPPAPPKLSFASFVLLPPMRGVDNQIQTLAIPAATDYVATQLQLEFADYAGYRVALVEQSGDKNLWQSGKLKAKNKGENKTLNLQFPAHLLKSQIYSLRVSGINPDGKTEVVGDYSFRAVIK